MRKILLSSTTAFAMSVCMASAGGMAEPVMEPEVVAAATSSSSGGIIIPLLLLLVIAAAVSSSGGSDDAMASDARIKTDVQWVGMAKGFPIYQYRYIGTATRFEGVMAQDVLNIRPDAVITYPTGMMAVRYDKLGLKIRVVH